MLRDGLLIFNSIHKVMRAEKVLKDAGLDVRLIPVPRSLSSDCGLAMECCMSQRDDIARLLGAAGCPAEQLHQREGDEYRLVS